MCASVAAITRNSPAMSRLSSCIRREVLEVLLGDQRDGDVEDVELVLADQVQQQVERPLEVGQRDAEGVARRERSIELAQRLIASRGPSVPDARPHANARSRSGRKIGLRAHRRDRAPTSSSAGGSTPRAGGKFRLLASFPHQSLGAARPPSSPRGPARDRPGPLRAVAEDARPPAWSF